jgi:CheY-like chemotaxis protein
MVREKEEILVIDDDRASRRMLVRALADAGYDCREARGGVEALEMLHAAAPSLLLLDFHMPELNGAEVLGRLRADEDPAIAQLPAFKTINYVLTWAWTAAIALMLVANITMIYVPALPLWVGVGIAFAARNCAVYFTKWYPAHRQAYLVAQSN